VTEVGPAISASAILIWMLVQWIALLLAADRVPLAAHYFPLPELHASQILLAAQFSWTAIFFPVLCRSWQMGIATLVSGWVMLVLAAMLSAWQMSDVVQPAAYLGLWVVGLGQWRRVLTSNWLQMMGSSLIATFTIGGPLVWYFGTDLGKGAADSAIWKFGPMLGILLRPAAPPPADWLILSLMAALGFAVLILPPLFFPPHFAPLGDAHKEIQRN